MELNDCIYSPPLQNKTSLRKKETFCQIVRDVIFSYVIFSREKVEVEGCYLPEYKGEISTQIL